MRQNSEKLAESFTDGEGKTTHYEYGAFDLLTALVRPDGERLTCRYDKLTRLTEITNAAGDRYCLKYDKAGQLVAETDFTGRTLTYTYDAAGRCIRTSFPDGTHLNRRYNVTDQLTDEEVTHGESNRTLSTTTFRYDTQCRLVEAKNDAATVIFEYNDANQIVAETLNGRRTEYGYDPELDTVTQRTSAGITERFTYDKNLNITRRQTWVNEVLESETHQQLRHGRVVSREHKGWRHQMHRINPDTGKPEEGKFVRVVNAHNITWKYDINGRLVEKLVDKGGYRPLQWRYRWDAKSQLTGLESLEGERWAYKYDPFGRRINKRSTNRDKPRMDFHWNGDQLTAEITVDADGKPEDENAIRWIYEPGSFAPLARYQKEHLHYAVTNTVGRIQEQLTEEGTTIWKGKPHLWGKEEGRNWEGARADHQIIPDHPKKQKAHSTFLEQAS
ncbi:RHS repeat domain-containing protein [Hafnia alvei]|uniref:RHS repeat protein n=1 Tax=Hafnia alvei TaxID=569 RepID=UPI000E1BBF28|nr:RHS repeat protein [Hafnia alvei]